MAIEVDNEHYQQAVNPKKSYILVDDKNDVVVHSFMAHNYVEAEEVQNQISFEYGRWLSLYTLVG